MEVTALKTKTDYAKFMATVANEIYPDAKKITLVMDNYPTHTVGAFYEVFEPQEAK